MRKAKWTSEDGRFQITLAVYDKRGSFLAASRRIHPDGPRDSVRGQAITWRILDYKLSKSTKKRVEVHILMSGGWCTPGIFAHECAHVAHHLTTFFSKRILDAEETRCCYLDTIVDLFDPWLRKHKLYDKRSNNWHQGLMW